MRKHLFIIISLIFLLKKIDAQTNVYHPFPDSSALWNETSWWASTPVGNNPQIEFFGGDTIISNIHYKKIMASGYEYASGNQTCCNYVNRYLGALRQDTAHKKVYFCNASTTKDTLLYNFNLHVGDTLKLTYINHIANTNYVSSIDSILIGTTYRKQYNINGLSVSSISSSFVSLIEGIGSTLGLLEPLVAPFESGSALNCFSQNHVTLYPAGTDSCSSTVSIKEIKNNSSIILTIYPNPAQNNFTIKTNTNEKQNLQVFDVNDKLVLTQTINGTTNIDASTLAQGVYNVSLTSNEGVVNKRLVVVK
jgi:hypothetical protein